MFSNDRYNRHLNLLSLLIVGGYVSVFLNGPSKHDGGMVAEGSVIFGVKFFSILGFCGKRGSKPHFYVELCHCASCFLEFILD